MGFFRMTVLVVLILMLTGCATAKILDGEGNILYEIRTGGFARNGEFMITQKDGTVIYVKTESNTANAIDSINNLFGTVFNAASKVSGGMK
jgi:hypothetical protein